MQTFNYQWTTLADKRYLKFSFESHFSTEDAKKAAEYWLEEFNKLNLEEKNDIIFDCVGMKNYDTDARKIWQDTMLKLKPQIGNIFIISDNILILGAAKTMGLITGFKIKPAKSEEIIIALNS
jgi:methionine salvage enolase-phosphatase E1